MMGKPAGKQQKQAAAVYLILFAAAAAGSFAGLFLDGKSLIWRNDAVGQYYPAFLYIGQYLREFFADLFAGHPALPLYDLRIGFGEDIIGTLNYYGFGDPFNLAAVFATEATGVAVYECLFFLKALLAGFSLIAYLSVMGITGWPAAVSAVAYALSGFTVGGAAMYAEWGTLPVYFPLMLLGAERLMQGREAAGRRGAKGGLILTGAVALGALSGFYFLYMASLALAVYVIARLVARRGARAAGENFRTCLVCLGYYLIGIFLASPILLPALDYYRSSQRAGMPVGTLLANPRLYMPGLNKDIVRALLQIPADPEKTLLITIPVIEGLSALLLIAAPSRLLPFKRARKELLAALVLAAVALSLPFTGYLFNAFGETNDRWVFLIYFLFAVIAGYVLMRLRKAAARSARKEHARRPAVLCVLMCAAIVLNIILTCVSLYGQGGLDWSGKFLPAEGLNERYIVSPAALSEEIRADGDEELFRVATSSFTGINGRPENIAMLNSYNGTTYWWSIVNGRTQAYVNLVNSLGYRWRSFGLDHDAAAETAAGVRYYVTDDAASAPAGYEAVETVSWDSRAWTVYENPAYDGMAYLRRPAETAAVWKETVKEGSPDETEELVAMAHHRNIDDPWDKSGVDGTAFHAYLDRIMERRAAEADEETRPAVIYDRLKSRIIVTLTAEEGDQLVMAVPFSKNWAASLDGKKTEIHDTDIMFTAVDDLTAGRHTVVLAYRPKAFYAGLVLCAPGIVLTLYLLIGRRRKGEGK